MSEVMIVVAIIGIASALAGPSVLQWLQRYELMQATTTLATRLQGARVAAISRNRQINITICQSPNPPCNSVALIPGQVQAQFTFPGGAAALTPETFPPRVVAFNLPQAGPLTFNSRGMSTPPVSQTVQLFVQISPAQELGYSVTVNPVGKVSWCLQQVATCP